MHTIAGALVSADALRIAELRMQAAVAVLKPQADATSGATSYILTSYNDSLLLFEDTSSIALGDFPSIFCKTVVFLHSETHAMVQASAKRFSSALEAVSQGRLLHTSLFCLHVSRVGRLKGTHTEIFATATEQGTEMVVSMLEVPSDALMRGDLDLTPPVLLRSYSTPPLPSPPPPSPPSPCNTTQEQCCRSLAPVKQARHHKALKWSLDGPLVAKWRDRANKECSECGATRTPQWRCVAACVRQLTVVAGVDRSAAAPCVTRAA